MTTPNVHPKGLYPGAFPYMTGVRESTHVCRGGPSEGPNGVGVGTGDRVREVYRGDYVSWSLGGPHWIP